MNSVFHVGDQVKWTSQAGGRHKIKSGVVAALILAGDRPDVNDFQQLYYGYGCGLGRNHVSYVVLVGKKPYWPVASLLKKAKS